MSEVLERLACVEGLTLRRAWPRSRDHLLLEYVDEAGAIVAGQWHRDDGEPRLQRDGADRKLVGLVDLLAEPGATLISHRPERRAVLRLQREAGVCYAKVVRPSRTADLVERTALVSGLPDRPFTVPALLSCDTGRGVTVWSALPGASLHERLDDVDALIEGARTAGRITRWMHDRDPGIAATTHDADAEIMLIREQVDRLDAFHPDLAERARPVADEVCRRLSEPSSATGVLHRDLHDKQVILAPDGGAGLLDFDTVTCGERALDVANMLVHFELRAAQERITRSTAARAAAAFVDGYGPDQDRNRDDIRIDTYAAATRLRLACVYAFRPRWRTLAASWLGV